MNSSISSLRSKFDSEKIEIVMPKKEEWTIYGTNRCPHTMAAVTLLDQLGKKYKYYDISENKEQIYTIMSKYTKKPISTVPIIFNKQGKLIVGGNSSLQSCHRKDRTLGLCE